MDTGERETKRARVLRACDQCTRRKRKCDAAQPVCSTCRDAKRGHLCTYEKPLKRRGPAAGYVAAEREATKRVTLLERLLGGLILRDAEVDRLAEAVLAVASSPAGTGSHSGDMGEGDSPLREEALQAWRGSKSHARLEELMAAGADDDDDRAPGGPVGKSSSSPSSNAFASTSTADYASFGTGNLSTGMPDIESGFSTSDWSYNLPPSLPIAPAPDLPSTGFTGYTPPPPFPSSGGPASKRRPTPTSIQLGPSSHVTFLSRPRTIDHAQQRTPSPAPAQHMPVLPSETVVLTLLDCYLHSSGHWSLPILDKQALLSWSPSHDASEDTAVPHELAFAIFATALPHCGLRLDASLSVDAFMRSADLALHLKESEESSPNLATLQALVLLSFVAINQGELGRATGYFARAWAHASLLRVDNGESPSPAARRTFNGLVTLDALLALRVGRPAFFRPDAFNADSPPSTWSGGEEVELWRTPATDVLRQLWSESPRSSRVGTVASIPGAGGAGVARSSALSTFEQLFKLSVIALDVASAINRPTRSSSSPWSSTPFREGDVSVRLLSWEKDVPTHLRLRSNATNPSHTVELWLFFHGLGTLAGSILPAGQSGLNVQGRKHLKAGLSLVRTALAGPTFFVGRPHLEWAILTFCAMLCQQLPRDNAAILQEAEEALRCCCTALSQLAVASDLAAQTLESLSRLPETSRLFSPRSEPLPSAPVPEPAPVASSSIHMTLQYAGTPGPSFLLDPLQDVTLESFEGMQWPDNLGDEALDGESVLNFLGMKSGTRPPTPVQGSLLDGQDPIHLWLNREGDDRTQWF